MARFCTLLYELLVDRLLVVLGFVLLKQRRFMLLINLVHMGKRLKQTGRVDGHLVLIGDHDFL